MNRQVAIAALTSAALVLGADSHAGQTQAPACFGAGPTIVGSEGADQLIATDGADVIAALGGDDTIAGLDGDDRICGGNGSDTILAGAGDDSVDGGDGLDGIDGQEGDDELMGGGGVVDLLAFLTAGLRGPTGVRVDLVTGTATGEGSDRFHGFEAVAGSQNPDVLLGSAENNFFFPIGGSDTIDARGGFDIVVFQGTVRGDLAAGVATGTDGTMTSLRGVEGLVSAAGSTLVGDNRDNLLWNADRIQGRGGADSIAGGKGDNTIDAGAGNDVIEPGGGTDTIEGGAGDSDTLSFIEAPSGIRGDLGSGVFAGNGSVRAQHVENVTGSPFDDVLVGDDAPNSLYGNGGDDVLSGLGGADFLGGGSGSDSLDGGGGTDFCADGEKLKSCETVSGARSTAQRLLGVARPGAPTSATGIDRLVRALASSQPCASRDCGARSDRLAAAGRRLRQLAAMRASPLPPAKGDLVDRVLYENTPTCVAAPAKLATSIAPPKRVVPVAGLQDQTAEWYAQLVRLSGKRRSVLSTTPRATAVIAGRNVFTPGWPSWHDSANRNYVPPKPVRLRKAGRYAWFEYLSIVRTTHRASGLISPHYLRPGRARVSLCAFSR